MGWRVLLAADGMDDRREMIDVCTFGRLEAPVDIAAIGMSRSEASAVLSGLQAAIVSIQNDLLALKARERTGQDPTTALKDYRRRQIDTLFGRVEVRIPRLRQRKGRKSCIPLVQWPAHQRARPELEEALTRLGAWMSYRAAITLLKDFLPVEDGASLATAWRKTVSRGAEIAGQETPAPSGGAKQIHLSLDTTFIRSHDPEDGRHHEVLIGQAENDQDRRSYFGSAFDDKSAAARAVETALVRTGRSSTSSMTVFTDGAGALRQLCGKLGVKQKPILDWFHIAMRIRHVSQAMQGLWPVTAQQIAARDEIAKAVERIRWKLWHGRADALESGMARVRRVLGTYKGERKYLYQPAPSRRVWAGLFALEKYVRGQDAYTTNYAKLHGAGKRVGTSMSESAAAHLVNARMNRNHHMRWSRDGAHNLLHLRAHEFNRVYNTTG